MPIGKTRNHRPASQIDRRGRRTRHLSDRGARSHGGESTLRNGHGFGHAERAVDSDDVAVDQDRVGRRLRLREPVHAEEKRDDNAHHERGLGRTDHRVPAVVAARMGVVSVPMPSISIVTTSPGLRNSGGLRPAPTPSGVPLEITSPGYSVRIDDKYRTMCASSQIRFAVLPSCFTTPFTFVTMWKCGGLGANSFGTMNGPNGADLSRLF